MTAATIGKIAAAAIVTASAALGAFKAGRAAGTEPQPSQVAPSTASAPALTSADLIAVRDEMRQLRIDTTKDIASVRDDVRELRKEIREARHAP